MKILVIDDDQLMLTAMTWKLKEQGFEISTSCDAMEAISLIQKRNIDLIISDIMMPGMSGLELLSLLKQFYLNKIPLILMSSLDEGNLILKSLDLGAYDFITKPIDFDSLHKKICDIQKGISAKN